MSNRAETADPKPELTRGRTPKLRFPEFQDALEWEVKPLGKLLTIGNGKDYKHLSKGDIPVYGTGGYMLSVNDYLYDGESVCIGRKGTIDKPVFLTGKFWTVDTLFYTHSFKKCLPKFIYLCFQNIKWVDYNAASGVPSLSKTTIDSIEILIPPLLEQQKIADCLSSLEQLITTQSHKLEALELHKKGLMQQLFPAEGESVPGLRFGEFRDSLEWEEKPLGAVATFYNGRAYKQEELLEKGKYRVLRVGNFFTNNNWYYSDIELDETKYCDNGDLLYAWSASFGPRIWKGEKVIYHYHIWKVVGGKGINKKFLFIVLENETEKMKSQSANGLGLLHITKGTIEGWKVNIPSLLEQQKIADCLTSLEELITAQKRKLEGLKIHKKGLMQGLFPAVDMGQE